MDKIYDNDVVFSFVIFQMAESVDLVLDSQNESLISFNQTEEENGTLKNETIDCGVLDEDYIRVWTGFQWWLEGILFTGLGIAGEVQNVDFTYTRSQKFAHTCYSLLHKHP